MNQRNILVTGGAGFIGSNFVHLILSQFPHDRITVLDKLTYAGNLSNLRRYSRDPRLAFRDQDLVDGDAVESTIRAGRFTHIVHFAAESHVDRSISDPGEFVRTNVLGTFHLLEAIRKSDWARKSDRFMLHVSTDEVFGSLGSSGHFTEVSPYSPNSPYSASKAASDHLVRAYFHTYGLPVGISNCSNNYGPFQFPEKLIPVMILNCLQGKPLPVYGAGQNVRDWLFVEDHCAALEQILKAARPGETYCIGGGQELKNIDLVEMICRIMDTQRPEAAPHSRLIQFVDDRPGHDFRYAIDSSKIQAHLGWKPSHTFEQALGLTIEWYLNNPWWWKEIQSGEYRSRRELSAAF